MPDRAAELIGWPPGSPFQLEVGFHDGAWGLLGFLSICIGGSFWLATGLGWSFFMLGATYGHLIPGAASVVDCRACALKPRCCPNMLARRIVRDVNEEARDVARALSKTAAFEQSRRYRKRVEMLFAHLKRILRL